MSEPPARKTATSVTTTSGQDLPATVDELPVVARLIVEVRSDGSRTIARGAMEDAASDTRIAVEASGSNPLELALGLAKTIRWSIHGSTNGNYRSLENDKDFELVVLVDDQPLARDILARARDVDVARSRHITGEDVHDVLGGFRIRNRGPRTLLLISRASL